MQIFYLDHNIYIYTLSDSSVLTAIDICKNKTYNLPIPTQIVFCKPCEISSILKNHVSI